MSPFLWNCPLHGFYSVLNVQQFILRTFRKVLSVFLNNLQKILLMFFIRCYGCIKIMYQSNTSTVKYSCNTAKSGFFRFFFNFRNICTGNYTCTCLSFIHLQILLIRSFLMVSNKLLLEQWLMHSNFLKPEMLNVNWTDIPKIYDPWGTPKYY